MSRYFPDPGEVLGQFLDSLLRRLDDSLLQRARRQHFSLRGKAYACSAESPQIREIPIEPPVKTLAHLLREGQRSEPGRTFIERAPGGIWRFSFKIWNEGEFNNSPSGGGVEGTLRLVLDEESDSARLLVDRWEFVGPGEEG